MANKHFSGKATEVAEKIIAAFENNTVPEALATVFINFNTNTPQSQWSWGNQFLTAIQGATDARGFNQWKKVGRKVNKGEKALYILAPLTKTYTKEDPETGEEKKVSYIYGFRGVPVFDISQTSGDPLPDDNKSQEFIDNLPLVDVAKEWDINLNTYNGQGGKAHGRFSWISGGGNETISMGVENASTFAHELVHAAEYKLGNLSGGGQQVDQEVVAELGGATLLTIIGQEYEADLGGAYEYITSYANTVGKSAAEAGLEVINRISQAVGLILETSEQVATN